MGYSLFYHFENPEDINTFFLFSKIIWNIPIPFPNKNRNYILNVVHFEVILIVIENTSNFLIDAVITFMNI
jgi:hypothetical protein